MDACETIQLANSERYRLCSIVCHQEKYAASGHYTNVCRCLTSRGEWWCYNNQERRLASCAERRTTATERSDVLFYEQISSHQVPMQNTSLGILPRQASDGASDRGRSPRASRTPITDVDFTSSTPAPIEYASTTAGAVASQATSAPGSAADVNQQSLTSSVAAAAAEQRAALAIARGVGNVDAVQQQLQKAASNVARGVDGFFGAAQSARVRKQLRQSPAGAATARLAPIHESESTPTALASLGKAAATPGLPDRVNSQKSRPNSSSPAATDGPAMPSPDPACPSVGSSSHPSVQTMPALTSSIAAADEKSTDTGPKNTQTAN